MLHSKTPAHVFLLVILLAILYFCYLIFKPFLIVVLASGMLVSIFYGLYLKLLKWTKDKRSLAALIMCLLIVLVVLVPVANFVYYLSIKSMQGYEVIAQKVQDNTLTDVINTLMVRLQFPGMDLVNVKELLLDASGTIKDVLVSGGAHFVKGTGQLITTFVLMIFTMFFLFRDGDKLLKRIMYLTPLQNKYDREIFKKFKEISHSTIVATFVTAVVQGIVGAIGFMIVGVPAFFAGVLMAFFSLLPYVGAFLVWAPVAIYLLFVGAIWQAVFLIIWGMVVVGLIDNVLKPMLIKGKANIHPLIIFFSILGGISVFGFWGVIFGPLIVSIAFTILHIYEIEYKSVLEK